jgi:hypothetical protein
MASLMMVRSNRQTFLAMALLNNNKTCRQHRNHNRQYSSGL